MLERTLEYLNVEKGNFDLDFADADKISEEAKSVVATMQALNIFSGKPGNAWYTCTNKK
ncbi:hypothetical protein [Lysinibacillus xylanilyticus]|uniref:Uncharacterized protein n=1 Tax=Lysinibacillus xylanilyticus TaxID=582475 RepID=A0ABV3VXA5_9BACI